MSEKGEKIEPQHDEQTQRSSHCYPVVTMVSFWVHVSIEYRGRDGSSEVLSAKKKFSQPFVPHPGWTIDVENDEHGISNLKVSSVKWMPVVGNLAVHTERLVYCDSKIEDGRKFLMSLGWECLSR